MSRYLVLAQHEGTAKALGAWLQLLGEAPLALGTAAGGSSAVITDPRCHVWHEPPTGGGEADVIAYERLARWLNESLSSGASTDRVVLVDAVRPELLNPLQEGILWEGLIAQLILTFPDLHWVFAVSQGGGDKLFQDHSLPALLEKPRRDPIFDPTGLRGFVRARANEHLPAGDPPLPERPKQAAAMDEEESYALFHAYTAYRFGFRADIVKSWSLMTDLFEGLGTHGFALLFEDVNLNFPDKPADVHLSDFSDEGRGKYCKKLSCTNPDSKPCFRIIVTSGHSGADRIKMRRNRDLVMRHNPGQAGFVLKPVGGMFDLWRRAGLQRKLGQKGAWSVSSPPAAAAAAVQARGHSAPGKLLITAEQLIRRAESACKEGTTLGDWLRGAVYATDALELLRYQTPTLALQALALKHELEVRSEVAFLGVGYHFEVRPRLRELQDHVTAAARFFEATRRRATELDALVSITTRVMMVFKEAGQFDEEQVCLAQIRGWHRRLRIRQLSGPFDFLGQLVLGYAEFLLAAPGRFIAALALWYLGVFAGVVLVLPDRSLVQAASLALNSFFIASPPLAETWTEMALYGIASLSGLLHLGILISYLYSALSRK